MFLYTYSKNSFTKTIVSLRKTALSSSVHVYRTEFKKTNTGWSFQKRKSPTHQSAHSAHHHPSLLSQCYVCVSRGSWLTPDPGLMRAITSIKRGWLEGVSEWGLNNYTALPSCLSSWLRKLQSPSLSPTLFQSAHKRKGLWKIINYLGATLTRM